MIKVYEEEVNTFEDEFDALMEAVLTEELRPAIIKKKADKLKKKFPYKALNKDVWTDREKIIAAGLDANAMKSWYNIYMKNYDKFQKYLSKEYLDSVKHEEALEKAAEALKEIKKAYPKIKKFETLIRQKGTKKAAQKKWKEELSSNKARAKEEAAMQRKENLANIINSAKGKKELFKNSVRSKLMRANGKA